MLLRSKGLRVAVHPHSSLSAHTQILKLLHKQRVLCVKTKYYLFFFLQLCSNFKHMFCAIHRYCYHFAQRTLFKKKKKKNYSHVNNIHSNVVSNNLSEILLI